MATDFHGKKRVLYIKAEGSTPGTYVTNAALFTAANAVIPAGKIKYSPSTKMTERDVDGPSLQSIAAMPGVQSGKITFETRMFTSGTAGTASPLDGLLVACAQTSTVVAATSVSYQSDPKSTSRLSIGVGVQSTDGTIEEQYAIKGALGTYKISAGDVGEPFKIEWEFLGAQAYNSGSPVLADNGTPTLTITYANEILNAVRWMGITATTGIFTRKITSFTFDRGLKAELATDITDPSGHDFARFGGESPSLNLKAAWAPGATDLTDLIGAVLTSSSFTSGGAGKIITGLFPNPQKMTISDEQDSAKRQLWGIKFDLRRTATGAASDAYTWTMA